MVLELGKALSLFLSIASLLAVASDAFFVVGIHWEDRLGMALLKLGIAACVCYGSGLLFAYPEGRLTATLPVQLFYWALAIFVVLFAMSWFLACGNPFRDSVNSTCASGW